MIYLMSDIHGNKANFDSIMQQIALKAEDTLYVLGDVIDRYPCGIEILRYLLTLKNVKMLLGNHEYMMLNALGYPYAAGYARNAFTRLNDRYLWYLNSGEVTHRAFDKLTYAEKNELIKYLLALPLNIDIEVNQTKYKLVHAAPVEYFLRYRGQYANAAEFAVWQRWAEDDPDLPTAVLVFGHTPTNAYQKDDPLKIWYATNRKKIGLDCGCGFPKGAINLPQGRLACLRLDDFQEFYSEI